MQKESSRANCSAAFNYSGVLEFLIPISVSITDPVVIDVFPNFCLILSRVPLTGFGNLLAEGVRKAVDEKGILGAFTGGFTAAATGLSAAVICGFLVSLIFKSKDK